MSKANPHGEVSGEVAAGVEEYHKALVLDDGVDRSDWGEKILKEHPELLELKERLQPLHRAIAFGSLYNIGRSDVKQSLSRQVILKLILQHLQYEGLKQTKKALEDESHVKAPATDLKESALVFLLRDALRDTEKVYDYIMGDVENVRGESPMDELIEHLLSMGVEDDADEEEDVNIWEDNATESLVLEDSGGVKAGSLNKLVERLTPEKSYDLTYMRTFLITYQSFCKPDRLLLKLIQRYHVPKPKDDVNEDDYKRNVVRPIQLRVCNVLMKWIERHFADFNDKLVMNLNMFIDNTLLRDGHDMLANQMRGMVQKKLAGEAKGIHKVMFSDRPPEPKVPKNIFSPTLKWHDIDEEEIARQLTLLEFNLYAKINPNELLNQAWNKAKLKHRAHNVLAMIHRFNQVSGWVASSIIRADKIKDRVKLYVKFITIAYHLKNMNNFNTCMAIIAGMNNAAVHRLKHTKSELPRRHVELFEEMEQLLSRDENSKVYREALHNSNPPCIPYLGVYLSDLTFMEDGNPDLHNGLINFKKRSLVSSVILEVQQYQLRAYNLLPVHQIQVFLNKFPRVDEQELYRLSLVREPRNADRDDIE